MSLRRNPRITTLTDPPKRRLPTVPSNDDEDEEEVVLREKPIVVKPFKPPPKTEPFSSLTITTKPKISNKTGVSANLIKATKPIEAISVKPPKSNLILNNNNKLVVNKNIRERDKRIVEAPQQRRPPQTIFGALSKRR